MMSDSPGFLRIYCGHSIIWQKNINGFYWMCLLGHLFLVVLIKHKMYGIFDIITRKERHQQSIYVSG